MPADADADGGQNRIPGVVLSDLKRDFEVQSRCRWTRTKIDDDIRCCRCFHPNELKDTAQVRPIDQFIISRWELIACLDPMSWRT